MCTKFRKIIIPHLDQRIKNSIEKGSMTAKVHPGKVQTGTSSLPDQLVKTIKNVLKDTPFKHVKNDSEVFCKHLLCRQLPATNNRNDRFAAHMNRNSKIEQSTSMINNDNDDSETQRIIQTDPNTWYPIKYTTHVGKQYLVGRMAAEYAVLNRIFAEIMNVYPNFEPHSLFDFGSGVGTVSWVARKFWEKSLQEYFCVDSSSDMNELAKLVLKGGNEDAPLSLGGLYFRQFLPATATSKYSLVVSSYSFFELPSAEVRLETISKLWNKTEDFLIIVEPGTRHGFQIVNEVRDFILQSDSESKSSSGVHVFAPCPHEFDCPHSKMSENPCRFKAPYLLPAIARNAAIKIEKYSYVVLKKGKRPTSDNQWPRVIASPIKRKKHTHCRLCTGNGSIHEIVFTKQKHGLTTYHCGRSIKLGDRLPVEITETELDFDSEEI